MERDFIQRRLDQAQATVRLATEHARNQRSRATKLERHRLKEEATSARDLLATLEDCLALHVEDRDRIVRELVDFDRQHPQAGDAE
jgi:hypothetical protein